MITEKKDPLTGESFIPKRHNQSFANRANQIIFNNNKARKKRQAKAFVDKPLDKNRSILVQIMEGKDREIKSTEFLRGAGFDFRYFSMSVTLQGKPCQLVYEFGLQKRENEDAYTIVRCKPSNI
jgi:hypothetical protein